MVNRRAMLLGLADYCGTAIFAATGVLASARRKMTWVGAIVLAIATAVGGGTLRDLLSGDLPVFWIKNPHYLIISVATALVMLALLKKIRSPDQWLQLPDALALGLFTWIGCEKVYQLHEPWSVTVLMGVMTGTAGGLIRDVISAKMPYILSKGGMYVAASVFGAMIFSLMRFSGGSSLVSGLVCLTAVFLFRLSDLHFASKSPRIKKRPKRL